MREMLELEYISVFVDCQYLKRHELRRVRLPLKHKSIQETREMLINAPEGRVEDPIICSVILTEAGT